MMYLLGQDYHVKRIYLKTLHLKHLTNQVTLKQPWPARMTKVRGLEGACRHCWWRGYIPLNKKHFMSYAKTIRTTSVAANRIKEIKDNWDWYRSAGLLKGWSQFKYRKIGGTKWSRVICCIPEDDLIKKIGILMGARIEVIADELKENY